MKDARTISTARADRLRVPSQVSAPEPGGASLLRVSSFFLPPCPRPMPIEGGPGTSARRLDMVREGKAGFHSLQRQGWQQDRTAACLVDPESARQAAYSFDSSTGAMPEPAPQGRIDTKPTPVLASFWGNATRQRVAILLLDVSAFAITGTLYWHTKEPACFVAAALCGIGAVLVVWDLVTGG